MKIILKIMSVIDSVARQMMNISAYLLLVLTLIIGYEVFMRYIFTRSTMWAADFSEYILLYSTFLAAGWLLKEGRHVRITILTDYLKPKAYAVINFFSSLLGAAICGILIWQGSKLTWTKFVAGTVFPRPIQVPQWIMLAGLVIASIFLCIYFIRSAVSIAMGDREQKPDSNE